MDIFPGTFNATAPPMIHAGHVVHLQYNRILSAGENSFPCVGHAEVTNPHEPAVPIPVSHGPSKVDLCDDVINVDISSSLNMGGRPAVSIQWNVTVMDVDPGPPGCIDDQDSVIASLGASCAEIVALYSCTFGIAAALPDMFIDNPGADLFAVCPVECDA